MKHALKNLTPTPESGVLGYMKERTVKTQGQNVPTASLYYAYRKWTKLIGINTVSAKRFFTILEEQGYDRRSSPHGQFYRDLGFIN
jgi:hypothetical protein